MLTDLTGGARPVGIFEWLENLNWSQMMESGVLTSAVRVAVLVLVGLPLLRLIAGLCGRLVKRRFTPQSAMLVRKGVFYGGSAVVLVMMLQEMGFSLAALIGAAGIAGVAIGFASQTSLSNIISGIFLISEKPFQVGDLIKIGDNAGFVLSIDLLSVKLRKFDNTYLRIPNETLIKGQVTNVTRFPIRRFDLNLGVAYREDISRAVAVLKDVADKNPYSLDEPAPMIAFTGFGDSALEIFFGVWFAKTDYLALRDSIMPAIKNRFDQEGIEIPFPHRTLYAGSVTDPFPVRVVEKEQRAGDEGEEEWD